MTPPDPSQATGATATVRPDVSSLGLPAQAGLLLVGIGLLAASSHLAIPMVPVPITLQTLAVTVIGAAYGWRLGVLTVLIWLGLAALGLPVLSGSAGLSAFAGPTAGYLVAFPFAAGLTGWLAARGWDARRPVMAFVALVAGNALCLALGWSWLALNIGAQSALVHGVLPFIPGALIKSAAGVAILVGLARLMARSPK